MLHICKKTERFSFKSGYVVRMAKHLKEDWLAFLQGDGSAQTHRHGVHFLQHHIIYALNFISRRYTKVYGR